MFCGGIAHDGRRVREEMFTVQKDEFDQTVKNRCWQELREKVTGRGNQERVSKAKSV